MLRTAILVRGLKVADIRHGRQLYVPASHTAYECLRMGNRPSRPNAGTAVARTGPQSCCQTGLIAGSQRTLTLMADTQAGLTGE